jgi:peptidoglycan/LPS O-acetylase OafA/YrhL
MSDVAGTKPAAKGDFHIPSIDGLRAISFLIVFLAHAGLPGVPGGFGVTVFFFLSGYLITTLLRMEHAASGKVSLRDFYLRRALRILPPFYLVLAVASLAVAIGVLMGELRPMPMLALVAHYANYWDIAYGTDGQPAGTGVYWSLAVEEHFYLAFPLVFIGLQRFMAGAHRAQALVLLALSAVVLAWRCHLVFSLHVPEIRTFLATDTRLDSILLGCVLAIGANPMLDERRISRPALLYGLFPAGVALLLFCLVYRAGWFRESVRYTLQGIGLAPVFVAAIREPGFAPFRFLNHRWLRRAGALSYSLYLVHQVVLYVLEGAFEKAPLVLRGVAALVLSVLLAELIQRNVEKPCARLRRKLAHATWLTSYRPNAAAPAAAGATSSAQGST